MKCRVCGSENLELYLDLGRQPHCNAFLKSVEEFENEKRVPLRMFFCHDCTLSQLAESFTQEEMFLDHPYVSGTTATLVAHFKQQAKDLVSHHGLTSSDLVVDIGSNDGTFLKGFKPYTRVLGVEPAAKIAADAEANNIETCKEFFNESTAVSIADSHGKAALITAAGVFFHVPDLHDVCRGLTKLLRNDGVLFVQAIYLGEVIKNNSFDNFYHEHYVMYTLKTLQHLLALHGLEVFDVSLANIHGGSLSVHAGFKGCHAVQATVGTFLNEERRQGLDRFDAYKAFAERIYTNRERLRNLIGDLRRQGKRIMAYGAPAKGNTLLNFFDLGSMLEGAVEKNPRKVGQFTPGTHLKVIGEDELKTPPDYYLVLPWNFLPEFIKREERFFQSGGRFIVPVPEPRVLPEAP